MAFIGNTPTTQAFTPAVDYFSGNGSTTAFTLSRPVASVAQVQVVIDNVAQNPSSAYTVSSNTITFTSAPLSGTNNIYVYYTSPITDVIAPGQGTVNTASLSPTLLVPPAYVSDQTNTSTGAFDLPAGTTAQRPASPLTGSQRWNTDLVAMEYYNGTTWSQSFLQNYTVEYLTVGGGGGGGYYGSTRGGGGGAGGYLASSTVAASGTSYAVTVGAGGTGSSNNTTLASAGNGSNTSFGTIATSIGGGGGAQASTENATYLVGASGGSGGGGGGSVSTTGTWAGGSATSGQGNAGGTGQHVNGSWAAGGGGGGAGAVGVSPVASSSVPNGGDGLNWQSLGTYYAGGGGGAATSTSAGAGGNGGGGAGTNSGVGTAGTANRGGGGGSGSTGGAGGSGVVIIRYSGTTQRGTGGTVTTTGGYTYHTFTSSGTFTA